jgi:hypothetical protein
VVVEAPISHNGMYSFVDGIPTDTVVHVVVILQAAQHLLALVARQLNMRLIRT